MEELIDEMLSDMDCSFYNRDFRDQYLIDLLGNVLNEISQINRELVELNINSNLINSLSDTLITQAKDLKLTGDIIDLNNELDYYIEKADAIYKILESHDIEVELFTDKDKLKFKIEE